MSSTEHVVLAGDGTRIAWREHRDGERAKGPPSFILTNGLSTTDEFWRPLIGELADERCVVDWWYRGHGRSESARSGDYAIATHADDLRRVTEAVIGDGGRPPVHVAFSMGVTVLLELYRARPDLVRAMVLVAGGADHPYASSTLFRVPGVRAAVRSGLRAAAPFVPAFSPIARRVAASRAIFPLARSLGALGEDAPREEVERFFRSVGAMDLRAYWGTMQSLMNARASDVLPQVRVPVLVVAPDRDVMALRADLEALRDAIPGASFLHIPRTSHAVLLEAGETIAARVRELVASLG